MSAIISSPFLGKITNIESTVTNGIPMLIGDFNGPSLRNTTATVGCYNQQPTPFVNRQEVNNLGGKIGAKCVMAHEKEHVKQYSTLNSMVCKNQEDGAMISVGVGRFDFRTAKPDEVFEAGAYRAAKLELPAYDRQLNCLKQNAGQSNTPPDAATANDLIKQAAAKKSLFENELSANAFTHVDSVNQDLIDANLIPDPDSYSEY